MLRSSMVYAPMPQDGDRQKAYVCVWLDLYSRRIHFECLDINRGILLPAIQASQHRLRLCWTILLFLRSSLQIHSFLSFIFSRVAINSTWLHGN